MKENQVTHVCWMYIYTAYSIGSKSSAYRKSIVVARYIWKQMNVAKKTIAEVSSTENYQCSQAVIGQLCIVSYRWLANSILSTIIIWKCGKAQILWVMIRNTNVIREEIKRRTINLGLYLDCKVGGEGGPTLAPWWFSWFFWQCEASHCLEGRKSDFLRFSSWIGSYPLLLPRKYWNNILHWWSCVPE